MRMNYKLLFLFPILFNCVFCAEISEYKCEEFENNGTCVLQNVITSWDNPKFKPTASRSSEISQVHIKSGNLPILSDSICSAFNYVTDILVSNLGIETIDDTTGLGAFRWCNNLQVLDLSKNRITKLHEDHFKGAWTLIHLNLEGNPLKEISSDIFTSIKKIRGLNLIGTSIPYFPIDQGTRELKDIQILKLSHIPLLDFEIEKVSTHLPSLKIIHLRDTNILCTRMDIIRQVSLENNIVLDKSLSNEMRLRDYIPQYFQRFECLSKDQWNQEVLRVRIDDLMTETKFDTLVEYIRKSESKILKVENDIETLNTNLKQCFTDVDNVSSYISFVTTTLVILLRIVSFTSLFVCCKTRQYVEEERHHRNVTVENNRNAFFDYNKNSMYF